MVLYATLLAGVENLPTVLEKYCNSRYGFCVEYPDVLLTQRHVSENNDGVALLSTDGNFQLRVYGYFNVMGWTVNDEYVDFLEVVQSNNPDAEVKELEKKFKEDEFEVLLLVGKKLHYERTVLRGNTFISMTLEVNRKGNLSFEDSQVQAKQLLNEIKLLLD